MEGFREFFNENISDQGLISFYNHNPDKKVKEISQITGMSIGEIYRTLHSYNVTPNRQKTNYHNVINFYNFGYGVPQIAELSGYTERNVRYILSKLKTERNNG
jgi:transcriptional antiterminator